MSVQRYVFMFDHSATHSFESKELAYYHAFQYGHQHLHQVGLVLVTK
jgi:hypothetical protein